jgi:formylglycine-generating enzyme required for sulfatase activity
MKTHLLGRADLARALKTGDLELQDAMAHFLGLERIPPPEREGRASVDVSALPIGITATTEVVTAPPASAVDVPFWQADGFVAFEPATTAPAAADEERPSPIPVRPRVPFDPLATRAATLTRLRRASSFTGSGEPDLDRIVERLSRAELLHRLPSRPRRRWGASLQLIVDRSRRLIPYWTDQELVAGTLARVYPRDRFRVIVLAEGESEPWLDQPGRRSGWHGSPEPGAHVIVLGDLGCLARDEGAATANWLEWGRRLRDNGNEPLALAPCHRDRCPQRLKDVWTIVPWDAPAGPAPGAELSEQVARRILTLLSFALRVEPRLIRAVRKILPEGRGDPGIESIVWQHEALASHHCDAAAFDPEKAKTFREEASQIDPTLRKAVYEIAAGIRQETYEGVWLAEILGLEREAASGLTPPEELRRAVSWFRNRKQLHQTRDDFRDPAGDQATWTRRVLSLLPEGAYEGAAATTLHELSALVGLHDEEGKLPAHLDPRKLPSDPSRPIRTYVLSQEAQSLVARPFEPGQGQGSPLGLIRSRNGVIRIEPVDAFWEGGIKPAWAVDWGRDPYGAWATFQVKGITQKMRWIPPGNFLMSSPDDEHGRRADEVPQHDVTIETGFWMFETPCTQALWEAVKESNPSHFRGLDRPVEGVSWDDIKDFLARISELAPGLRLELPTEEQWEYACRAGSPAARYGDLDEIAWYGENSGGETHPVATKQRNTWGLSDMLGNVWEWCADEFPSYWEKSAIRVLRGGSWSNDVRNVRAAYRLRIARLHRSGFIGFRCAEFESPGPAAPRDDQTNKAQCLELSGNNERRAGFPAIVPVRVVSDLEELSLRTMTRPRWASAIGRDRYGLWAEFALDYKVRQRLRWIPPGRFEMGSPKHEAGRSDNEGPQREVTIDRGFWMFETPCTQSLWEGVMGDNPSRFRSPDRPVEQVSWNDCQEFMKRLNGRLEGLVLSLPSEAQWEYACRAGTQTATYAGDMDIRSERDAPVLDPIAWHGGNCGVDFELENGLDVSTWTEVQHRSQRGGTHPVGRKHSNDWGLYDMLGNVWEWCADEYRPYGSGGKASADRMIRGGSWRAHARHVRAAFRFWDDSTHRLVIIGFRCAEFREPSTEKPALAKIALEHISDPTRPEDRPRRRQREDR